MKFFNNEISELIYGNIGNIYMPIKTNEKLNRLTKNLNLPVFIIVSVFEYLAYMVIFSKKFK